MLEQLHLLDFSCLPVHALLALGQQLAGDMQLLSLQPSILGRLNGVLAMNRENDLATLA